METYYYIYKIHFLKGINTNRYYIGKHKTYDLDDGYVGSGRFCNYYFKKYGKINGETYWKEILEFNDSDEINSKREFEIIGNLWKTDPFCKNQKPGGKGGWISRESPFKGKHHTLETKKKLSEAHKNSTIFHEVMQSEAYRHKMSESKSGVKNGFYGKHHSEESKQKISNARKGKTPWNKGLKINVQ